MSILLLYAYTTIAVNPWSYRGCFNVKEVTHSTVYDNTCVSWRAFDDKCLGGLPFYRFPAVEGCNDCLSPGYCKLECLSRGLDVVGIVTRNENPVECRCGASLSNRAVWASLGNTSEAVRAAWYLQPPDSLDEPDCNMQVWDFSGPRDDQGYPVTAVTSKRSSKDEDYIQAIVTGTALKTSRLNSVNLRAHRWFRVMKNVTVKHNAPRHTSKILVEVSTPGCDGVVEDKRCWKKAMADIPTCGDHCSPGMWQSKGFSRQWLNFTTTGRNCPITSGKCSLFHRPNNQANSVPRWPNATVTIFVNTSNPQIPTMALRTVAAAANIWANSSCISFKIVTKQPNRGPYAKVVMNQRKGRFAGCSAPLGPPVHGRVAEVNIASCADNNGVGMLAHELGHLIGFTSTLQRPDRDLYVKINWENIDPYYYGNFQVDPYQFVGAGGLRLPYDFGSIMHPSPSAGMIVGLLDHVHEPGTFTALQSPKSGITVGQRLSLSNGDVQAVKLLYGCPLSVTEKSVLDYASAQYTSRVADTTSKAGSSYTSDSDSLTSSDDTYGDIYTQAIYIADAISKITDEYAYYGGYLSSDQVSSLLRVTESTKSLISQCGSA